jgi:Holliday junction resolvase RusA-like endonuclease
VRGWTLTPELLARESKSPLERTPLTVNVARERASEKLTALREACVPSVDVEQPGLRVLADFTVEGPPQAWQRAQPTREGRMVVPKKTREFEKRVAAYGRLAAGPEPYRGPVALTVTFYLKRGKNCPPGLLMPAHQSCGDISNFIKSLEDGLNGVLWYDDRQVVSVSARKVFADLAGGEPRTHVSVEML